jgi:hypothetical protein
MNITRRKARVPIVTLGTAALVAAGGLLATPAHAAPTALTLNSGGTSPVVANLGTATTAAANAAYALKVSGSDSGAAISLDVASTPTGGDLAYFYAASNAAATAASFTGVNEDGVNEVQTVTLTNTPTGGTFTLTYSGQTTAAIAYNASAATVQAALEALSNIAPGDVAVTGTGPWRVAFGGALGGADLSPMTGAGGSLTGVGCACAVTIATPQAGGAAIGTVGTVTSADYVYVTGNVPGTYTFRLFQDTNTNLQLDADDERSTALITMTVLDAGGPGTTSSTTSDDVAPVIASTTPIVQGIAVTATITYSGSLSVSDARGSGVSTGLKARLAALTFIDVDDTGTGVGDSTENGPTYSTSTGATTYTVGTPGNDGTLVLRADLKASGAADNTTYGSKTIQVTDNGTADLSQEATEVTGSVIHTAANTLAVKSGTAAVTYTATAFDDQNTGATGDDEYISGAVIYFTLGGADVASLTTNGTTVDATNHVFSAVTNSDGVASLIVTSSATEAGDTYTVTPTTNGVTASPATITTTYADRAVTTVEITNTDVELTPSVGSSVTLKGRVLDQFEQLFQPPNTDSQQVQIYFGTTASGCSAVSFGVAKNTTDADANATLSGGSFTHTYTPASTPTSGHCTSFGIGYDINGGGTIVTAESDVDTINWASTTAAASVTLTTPNDEATGINLSDSDALDPGQAAGATDFGSVQGEVTGTVKDASNNLLAFKAVTLTGSDGVYFTTDNTGAELASTATAVTDASGTFDGVFAFFTKSGTVSVTATSGSVSDVATMTTDDPNDPYTVTVDDVSGMPGETVIVTGTVKDAFGNGMPGATVDLSTGTSTLGVLGDISPETNAAGVFSTTFLSGSNQSGTATLTATLDGQTANETAHADWLDVAEITVPDGDYQDSSTIAITTVELTLSATGSIEGYGEAELSGSYKANTTVSIYAKPHGEDSYDLVDSVQTDDDGNYGTSIAITKITSWLARSGDVSSEVETTIVESKVMLKAKAKGRGIVQLDMNGDPNAERKTTFYMVGKGGKLIPLKTVWTNEKGQARVFVVFKKKGAKTFRAYYAAPHTKVGFGQATVTVT